MNRRKTILGLLAVPLAAAGVTVAVSSANAQPELSGETTEYSVLAADGVNVKDAERAVRDAGGTVVRSNAAVGLITATAPANGFTTRLAVSFFS